MVPRLPGKMASYLSVGNLTIDQAAEIAALFDDKRIDYGRLTMGRLLTILRRSIEADDDQPTRATEAAAKDQDGKARALKILM